MTSDQEKETLLLPSSGESNEIVHQLLSLFSQIFSKEYLDTDPFLQSQVGLPLSLPTTAIYQSPRVLSITTDPELIRQAMESSNSLLVIENIVRPNVKAEQHTIILRDVEESVTEEEIIQEIFEKSCCPSLLTCRSEMNNTWFVTFSSESDARLALDKIKNLSLAGKPVRARLKTESFVRTYPRPQSNGGNSSPTFHIPQLVIDDVSNPSETSNPSQQTILAQSPQYYYPPMFPISPHLLNPNNGQSSESGGNNPQYPNIPGLYYMYPPPFPNGFIPHPMHHPMGPMGSPMYMGGVWMPPYPMMQMPPNSNSFGTSTQQTSGRGKHKQKSSPRNGQPYSPSRNTQNKTFNPKDRQQGANLPVEAPTSPKGQIDEKQEFEGLQEETKDQVENNGNKKKYFKKRRDRLPSQEGGQGITEEIKPNGSIDNTTKDDRKNKESQYQGGHYKQYNNNGNSNGPRVKGREKSKPGNQTQAKPIPPKPENKFNLEADFPSLYNAPVVTTRATAQQSSGISWAARISKSVIQPEPDHQITSTIIVDKSAADTEDELSANYNNCDYHDHAVDQIKFTPSQPLDELNISFGNVQISTIQTSDLILPQNHNHSYDSQPNPVENKSQLLNHSGPGKFEEKPIILTNIKENVEYVPISFGAFEATTIPLSSENMTHTDSSDTNYTPVGGVGGKLTFLDIVRKGKV